MITLASLRSKSAKELGALAKKYGVSGAGSLRKDDLIQAVLKAHKAEESRARRKAKSASVEAKKVARTGAKTSPTASAGKASKAKTGGASKTASASKPVSRSKSTPVSKAAPSKPEKSKVVAAKSASPAKAAPAAKAPAKMKEAPVKPAAKGSAKPAPASKPATAEKTAPAAKPISKLPEPRRPSGKSTTRSRAHATPSGGEVGPVSNVPAAQRLMQMSAPERDALKDLSGKHRHELGESGSVKEDRVVLLVRDAYWLQANWQVTRQSVERAQASMAEHWHTARPVLRLYEVDGGSTTGSSERPLRDVEIHGGVHNWYIDVAGSPRSLMVALGYLGGNGKFHAITRSNRITTPAPNSADVMDEHWADIAENYEKIYAQSGGGVEGPSALQEVFEEQLRRPMGSSFASRYGINPEGELPGARDFDFEVDAEMVIFGKAPAEARVTMSGEPIKIREDGSFTVRVAMPDRRQVIPITAASTDGFEQRTIVLAVERNTKVMEPKLREDVD